ncbi:hypothetical protein [Aerosakkonema funiforme]|uniref:hypothetical protein n=1 Tax=Aerosakkonema funiforme TaxID=1246630 RepID=UPI0035B6E5F7
MTRKRNRDSLYLSKEGQTRVEETRLNKFWSKTDYRWFGKAEVSLSTLKRFLNGKPISRSNFFQLCSALGIQEWESLIALDNKQDSTAIALPQPQISQPPDPLSTQPLENRLLSFMITGTFTQDKQAEIEVALTHLEKLLRDNCTITLVPEKNSLAVTGTFSESKKPEVEVALMHLEKLMLEYNFTQVHRK